MTVARSLSSRLLRGIGWLLLGWLVLTMTVVVLLRWVDPPTSAFIERERLISAVSKPSYAVKHRWVAWNHISAPMKVAVIASEDQLFPEHNGFDFKSINQAWEDREHGKRLRGASTISQQVTKNLFLWPAQSWLRKGLEVYFTLLIETFWPKQRILEVYLNLAEFGKGVFGVGAASDAFFHKSPARLTAADAALLAAVLPNPKRLRVTAPSGYVRKRQQWILGQMRGIGGSAVLADMNH